MNSMMETMIMTRRVMWRFKSSMDLCPGIPFHLLGGKESMAPPVLNWGPPGLLLTLVKGLEATCGSRIIYPFSSNCHSLMMVPTGDETGTKVWSIMGKEP